MRIKPPGRRSIVREGLSGLEIVIPSSRNLLVMLFLAAWLVGWAVGLVTVLGSLVTGEGDGPSLFGVAWLVMWVVAGGFALYTWLWMAAGREVVSLGPAALSIRRQVFGVGRTYEYDVAHVKNLRVAPGVPDSLHWGRRLWVGGLGGGPVAFDYGSETVRFGAALEEAEAAQVVRDLKARHAFQTE